MRVKIIDSEQIVSVIPSAKEEVIQERNEKCESPSMDDGKSMPAEHPVSIDKLLSFPHLVMRISGIYHKKTDRFILKIYPLVIILISWATAFKYLTNFKLFYGQKDPFSADLVLKINTQIFLIMCAFNGTIFFINQEIDSRNGILNRELGFLLNFNIDYKSIRKLKTIINLATLSVIIISFSYGIFAGLSFFGPENFYSAFSCHLSPFENTWGKNNIPYKIFIMIVFNYNTLHWTLSLSYFEILTLTIYTVLKNFNKKFKDGVKDRLLISRKESSKLRDDSHQCLVVTEDQFDMFKFWHTKICETIRSLDKCYKLFLGLSVLAYLLACILILYVIADSSYHKLTGFLPFVVPFWLCIGLLFLVFVSLAAGKIHEMVNNLKIN